MNMCLFCSENRSEEKMFGERMALEARSAAGETDLGSQDVSTASPLPARTSLAGVVVFAFGGMAGGKGNCSPAALSTGRGQAGSG